MIYVCKIPGEQRDRKLQHKVAHALLRYGLRHEFGFNNMPKIQCAQHGKPYFKEHTDIHFNLSHCAWLAVCAIDCVEVGIDAEQIRQMHPNAVSRALSKSEKLEMSISEDPDQAFFKLWTLKESFVKTTGDGLTFPLREAIFMFHGSNIECSISGYTYSQYLLWDEYILCLCRKQSDSSAKSTGKILHVADLSISSDIILVDFESLNKYDL